MIDNYRFGEFVVDGKTYKSNIVLIGNTVMPARFLPGHELKIDDFVILVGSWVELIYEENNIISDFQSNLKTKDIDFLIKNIRQPTEAVDLLKGFTDKGFEIDISGFDVYRIIKDDYEIEFLARMIGGKYSYVKVSALKIPKVEALSHTSMLLEDTIGTIYKSNNII